MIDKFTSDSYNFIDKELTKEELLIKRDALSKIKQKRPHRNRIENIITNSIISFIIGDALGVPLEFQSRDDCKEYDKDEMLQYMTHDMPKGTWSDDTSMVLATIDAISEKEEIDYDYIAQKFCDWLYGGEYTPYGRVFDVGATTKQAIINYKNSGNALESGLGNEYHEGNGSLMRMLPICLYTFFNKPGSESNLVDIINNSSSITHNSDTCKCACYIYTKYIHYLLEGYTKESAYELLKENDFSKYYPKEVVEKFGRILKNDIRNIPENDIKSGGYVVDTLEAVFWCSLKNNNYRDSLISAISLGNDTDTIAALVGSISGIIYDSMDIPDSWFNDVVKMDEISTKAKKYAMSLKQLSFKNKRKISM